jgi:tetratricopeptide (TPR) repeat protein
MHRGLRQREGHVSEAGKPTSAGNAPEWGRSWGALTLLLMVSIVDLALRKLRLWRLKLAVGRWAASRVPGSPIPHIWVGESHLALDRWEEAVGPLRAAYSLDPEDVEVALKLGQTLSILKRYEEAWAVLKDAPDRHPNDAWAHACLGQALAGLGRKKEAQERYRAALRLSPGNAEILALAKQVGLRGTWVDQLIASGELRR